MARYYIDEYGNIVERRTDNTTPIDTGYVRDIPRVRNKNVELYDYEVSTFRKVMFYILTIAISLVISHIIVINFGDLMFDTSISGGNFINKICIFLSKIGPYTIVLFSVLSVIIFDSSKGGELGYNLKAFLISILVSLGGIAASIIFIILLMFFLPLFCVLLGLIVVVGLII